MAYVPRVAIEQMLVDGASLSPSRPCIIQARRGAGKSSLLRQVASRVASAGRRPATIDIERICTSAADFARHFATAIDAAVIDEAVTGTPVTAPAARGQSSAASYRAREIHRQIAAELERRKPDPAV